MAAPLPELGSFFPVAAIAVVSLHKGSRGFADYLYVYRRDTAGKVVRLKAAADYDRFGKAPHCLFQCNRPVEINACSAHAAIQLLDTANTAK
jgi:hypothetical protein